MLIDCVLPICRIDRNIAPRVSCLGLNQDSFLQTLLVPLERRTAISSPSFGFRPMNVGFPPE